MYSHSSTSVTLTGQAVVVFSGSPFLPGSVKGTVNVVLSTAILKIFNVMNSGKLYLILQLH